MSAGSIILILSSDRSIIIMLSSDWSILMILCLAAGLTAVLQQLQDGKNTTDKAAVCKRAFLSEKILHGTPSGIDNSVR